MQEGQTRNDITLWEGFVPKNSFAVIDVLVHDQDNAQIPLILTAGAIAAVGIIALVAPAVVGDLASEKAVQDGAQAGASSLVNSLAHDADDTIGAFSVVLVHDANGVLSVNKWIPVGGSANTVLEGFDAFSAQFHMAGDGQYDMRVRVTRPPLVRIRNINSGKVLDVPDASLENGKAIQQSEQHDHANQRWYIKHLGRMMWVPWVPFSGELTEIWSDNSGSCLDAENAQTDNHTRVIQFPWHGGANQLWALTPVPDGSGHYFIGGLGSFKVFDIADASRDNHGQLQIYHYLNQDNQKWSLELIPAPDIGQAWP